MSTGIDAINKKTNEPGLVDLNVEVHKRNTIPPFYESIDSIRGEAFSRLDKPSVRLTLFLTSMARQFFVHFMCKK